MDLSLTDAAIAVRGVRQSVIRLLASLFCHPVPCASFTSPVISYMSMVAIYHPSKAWVEAGVFTQVLSALVWVAQLTLWRTVVQKHP